MRCKHLFYFLIIEIEQIEIEQMFTTHSNIKKLLHGTIIRTLIVPWYQGTTLKY